MKFASICMIVLAAVCCLGTGCTDKPVSEIEKAYPAAVAVTLENSTGLKSVDQAVYLDIADIRAQHPQFNPQAVVVFAGKQEVASQVIDSDGDGEADQLLFVTDLNPAEKQQITVRYAESGAKERDYSKRTQAELSHKVGGHFEDRKYIGGDFQNVQSLGVPPEHTDHSFFIRYEGPGWESDKVGYRFYLDWRNATDIFGKKTSAPVLQQVGLDGFDSYHEMSDWGMDVLKVGESLGLGSLAMWHNGAAQRVAKTDSIHCAITADGAIYSQVQTSYWGWDIAGAKHDVISRLSITAGSRMTRHDVQISGNPRNLCTGIVKHPETELIKKTSDNGGWSFLATWGAQSLVPDNLGMAVLYRQQDFKSLQNDKHSEVVVLQPSNGQLTYYFLAAWEKEPNGITTRDAFVNYLDEQLTRLNNPVQVTLR